MCAYAHFVTPLFGRVINLGKIFGDHLNVLSLSADDESMEPSWGVHLFGHNTVSFLVHLGMRVCVWGVGGGEDEYIYICTMQCC